MLLSPVPLPSPLAPTPSSGTSSVKVHLTGGGGPDWIPAAIGASALFVVWLLTQWADRHRDEKAHRSESVAEVSRATVGLTSSKFNEPFEEKRQRYWAFCLNLSGALVVFAAREIPKHQHVAEWTLRVAAELQGLSSSFRDAQTLDDLKPIGTKIDGFNADLNNNLTAWLRNGRERRFKSLDPK